MMKNSAEKLLTFSSIITTISGRRPSASGEKLKNEFTNLLWASEWKLVKTPIQSPFARGFRQEYMKKRKSLEQKPHLQVINWAFDTFFSLTQTLRYVNEAC